MKIRKAEKKDIPGMVKCHQHAFPGQPMTEMGSRWLSYLYTCFIEHPKGVSLVAVNGSDKVIGLAVGGDNAIRPEFIKKAVFKFIYLFPFKFLASSVLRKKFFQNLLSKFHKSQKEQIVYKTTKQIDGEKGVLLSICVDENCRGTAISSQLIQKFYEIVIDNYAAVRLTVRSENTRARKFYEKNGWILTYENVQEAKYLKVKQEFE